MSMMCPKEACVAKKGMCLHETVMLLMLVAIGLGALGHWVFHWY